MVEDTQKDKELEFLTGKVVSRIYVDFALGIQFFEKDLNATIRIEQALAFHDSVRGYSLSPEVADSLAPALHIFNTTVSAATVRADGTLFIEFSGGRKIDVPPHAKYEAWEIVVGDGRKLICMPGGKVVRWGAIKR